MRDKGKRKHPDGEDFTGHASDSDKEDGVSQIPLTVSFAKKQPPKKSKTAVNKVPLATLPSTSKTLGLKIPQQQTPPQNNNSALSNVHQKTPTIANWNRTMSQDCFCAEFKCKL